MVLSRQFRVSIGPMCAYVVESGGTAGAEGEGMMKAADGSMQGIEALRERLSRLSRASLHTFESCSFHGA